MTNQPWMQTLSGAPFDLLEPKVEQIKLSDIAYSLAGINRFNGHSRPYVSVAEHSVRVSRIMERMGFANHPAALLYALLHDAHEAYTGDMTRPMQQALTALLPVFKVAFHEMQSRIQRMIHTALGLPPTPAAEIASAVHSADMYALDWERRQYMAESQREWGSEPLRCEDHPEFDVRATCTNDRLAFLGTYRRLNIRREQAQRA